VDLHSVERRCLGPPCCFRELGNDPMDLLLRHLLALDLPPVFNRRRADANNIRQLQGIAARMGNLDSNLSSGLVDLIDHLLQRRHMPVGMDAQLSGCCLALGTDISVACNNQPHFPLRQPYPQPSEFLRRVTSRSRKPFPGSRPDETIGKSDTVEDGPFEELCRVLLLRDDIDGLPFPTEDQYDSYESFLSRKEKMGEPESPCPNQNQHPAESIFLDTALRDDGGQVAPAYAKASAGKHTTNLYFKSLSVKRNS
jgi:hypothetical protein